MDNKNLMIQANDSINNIRRQDLSTDIVELSDEALSQISGGSPFVIGPVGSPFVIRPVGSPFVIGPVGSPFVIGPVGSPFVIGPV